MKRRMLGIIIAMAILVTTVLPYQVLADSTWTPLHPPTEREAFWGENATVSAVCNAVVDALNAQAEDEQQWNYLMVLGVLGFSTLNALAIYTEGCYVRYETLYFQIPGQPMQYMYKITLLDENHNVMHGPFRYTPNSYVASDPNKDELI